MLESSLGKLYALLLIYSSSSMEFVISINEKTQPALLQQVCGIRYLQDGQGTGPNLPFSRSQLGRAHSLFGSSNDIADAKGSQGVFLLSLISQGCGAEVQDEKQAVQQAPSTEQLEVLVVLTSRKQERDQH